MRLKTSPDPSASCLARLLRWRTRVEALPDLVGAPLSDNEALAV